VPLRHFFSEGIAGRMEAIGQGDFMKCNFRAIHLLSILPPSWESWVNALCAITKLADFDDLDNIRNRIYVEADRRKSENDKHQEEAYFAQQQQQQRNLHYIPLFSVNQSLMLYMQRTKLNTHYSISKLSKRRQATNQQIHPP
jgi:hypothetical protein